MTKVIKNIKLYHLLTIKIGSYSQGFPLKVALKAYYIKTLIIILYLKNSK